MRDAAPRSADLSTEIGASHEGEFFLHVIEHPVVFFQALYDNSFDLSSCVEMQIQINATPAVFAQRDDVLNRSLLLLPARI
jgi:hypothetical protein